MDNHWNTANPLYYELLKGFAYKNRYNQTEAEQELWYHLSGNQLGLHFRRQHIIGCYIADFVCIKRKLIIEIDGGYHSQEEQTIKDYLRTEDLNKMGFEVMRFTNDEIYSNLSEVLDKIFNYISVPR
ncbi:MAG: endonuclease domain-containing protein [Prevotellaceae bacterium]|nr:endonuclease domain-containing protein [Prevotellaceae bacterium]MDO4992450.1 endonuclease domain-containing protein [Prevotellaceae bacterium]